MGADTSFAGAQIVRLTPAAFSRLAAFVTRELGIKMPESKVAMVQSRLLKRVRELGLSSIEEYLEYFFSASASLDERAHLIDAITTNKTDFFREPNAFEYLTQKVLPQLDDSFGINVWSAGCSSGEEPYTLAMVLTEYGEAKRGFSFRILATDVSTRVLAKARIGIYEQFQIGPVPPLLSRKYLLRSKNDVSGPVRIRPELRQKVSFHQLNFMQQTYPVKDTFEVIFCRNVLIYFERRTQEEVINKLSSHLAPGGHLFISHSESLTGMDIPLVPVATATFYKPIRYGVREERR